MLKKIGINILLFCVCSIASNAQMVDVKDKPSGYFGKRFLLGITGSFSASKNYQKAYIIKPEQSLTLNKDFSAFLHYSVSYNKSIGLIIGAGVTSFDPERTDFNGHGTAVYDQQGRSYFLSQSFGTPLVKDVQVGIDYKIYNTKKGAFSPLGQYYCIGLLSHFYNVNLSTISFLVYQPGILETIVINHSLPPLKFAIPELYVGLGLSKPILKKLFFDGSLKLGFLMIDPDERVKEPGSEYSDYFQLSIKRVLQSREFVNLNLGLAYPF